MIKIMVDSASDCKKEDGFFDLFMPITVNIDGKEYRDGVDLNADTFYDLLIHTEDFPHTSQPSPQSFVEMFEQVKADGDELIYFALSSALSGTYQGAVMAKDMVEYDGIRIIDTKTATHMIGVLAKYAHDLIGQGLSLDEIVHKCEQLKGKVKVLAGVDTLEYLHRGGRLSKTSATVGSLAGIKPVITVTPEGTVDSIGKCLGRARAMQFILDKLNSYEVDHSFPLYSLYTYGEENCEQLENKLTEKSYCVDDRGAAPPRGDLPAPRRVLRPARPHRVVPVLPRVLLRVRPRLPHLSLP